jgi:hypothetical protein
MTGVNAPATIGISVVSGDTESRERCGQIRKLLLIIQLNPTRIGATAVEKGRFGIGSSIKRRDN